MKKPGSFLENEKVIDRQELLAAFSIHSSGNWKKAKSLYQNIIGADPRHPDSMHILGGLAMCAGKEDIATEMLKQAIQLNPRRSHYYVTLGDVYKKQGQLEKALACYQKAAELDPAGTDLLNSLGKIYHLKGLVDNAASCFQEVLKMEPDNGPALIGLGAIYKDQGRTKDSQELYERFLKFEWDAGIEIKSTLLLPVICESIETIRHYREKVTRQIKRLKDKEIHLEDPYLQVGTTGFHLAYHGMNNKDVQQQIASLYLKTCPDLSWVNPACCDKKKETGKISIGIISQFLHQHTIGYLNYGIIKKLSRDKFHITIFRFKNKDDRLSDKINQAADEVIYLPDHLKEARRIIASQALDILFYLDIGMDSLTYFLAFSRLASVQCTTWGHADTSGIPNLDYYLSSAYAEPYGAQQHYSEQLVLLERFPMYCEYPQLPKKIATREKFGLPTGCNIYMCCQSLFKFHPDFDAIMKAVLERDQNGILLLIDGKYQTWRKMLQKRFARTIPEVNDRVHFQSRVPANEFLSFIMLADVLIDTLHFCGGYTSLLSFACGLPVVTLPGSLMRSRMTYAFYKQMGIFDCIATDTQSFADIAFALANNSVWREEVSHKIRERAPGLFEDLDTVHELERFFEWAVKEAEITHHQLSGFRNLVRPQML
jgi:protein O-GlcNAc transferase